MREEERVEEPRRIEVGKVRQGEPPVHLLHGNTVTRQLERKAIRGSCRWCC